MGLEMAKKLGTVKQIKRKKKREWKCKGDGSDKQVVMERAEGQLDFTEDGEIVEKHKRMVFKNEMEKR